MAQFLQFFLHLDVYLTQLTANYGLWIYLLLFLIIFCETGLVVTPFLPGDSLLFAAGALAALGKLNILFLAFLLLMAAILGNTSNFFIGRWLGPHLFFKEKSLFFNKKYLDQTHAFFESYGGKTLIIARFLPIIRTLAPFVAGIGTMRFKTFNFFNSIGAILWVGLFLGAGYFFGSMPQVKENFSLVIMAIIFVSVLPPIIEFVKHKVK